MENKRSFQSSPLALAILALLIEEPMHPYRMQQLLKGRGKHDVINISQRASFYQTIDRLLRTDYIKVREKLREEGRPDRTEYQITDTGRKAVLEWLRSLISKPGREYPHFPVALSFLPLLSRNEVLAGFEERLEALKATLSQLSESLEQASATFPKVLLLDMDYKHRMLEAELAWIQGIIEDLRSGGIHWTMDELMKLASQHDIQE